MANNTVYLNGEYLPLSEAKISVLDRGFLFGDGIYEVIPSYFGRLFHFQEHMKRLENSLAAIRLANPHSREQWLAILIPLLNGTEDQYIYLQITRGCAAKRDHAFPEHVEPTVFAMCSPIVPMAERDRGIKVVTMPDSRWKLCNAKAITLLANILHRQSAIEQDCAEAILIKDGYVTEGAASNVFAVINGVLTTPPKSNEILPGITRDVVLELAKNHSIATQETNFTVSALKAADEIWLTSSTREIIPVIECDGQTISHGKPGSLWQTLDQLFQAYKQTLA